MPIDRKALSQTCAKAASAHAGQSLAAVSGAVIAAAIAFLADTVDKLEQRLEGQSFKFMGVYAEGHEYAKGNLVTHQGSLWHANYDTHDRPGASDSYAWTLCVKRGSDGRDLRQ